MSLPDASLLNSKPIRLAYASAPCRGDSMRGTLSRGDCLWISPLPFASLLVGDVVAYDAGGKVVVHRIVGRDASGFRTQGDGNESRDAAPLAAGQLIGKVVARENPRGRTSVAGGFRGRWRGRVLRAAWRCRIHGNRCWAACARRIQSSGWGFPFWKPRILVVRFKSPAGSITKFIHRGKVVASWSPEDRQWLCRMPYDLVLSPPVR